MTLSDQLANDQYDPSESSTPGGRLPRGTDGFVDLGYRPDWNTGVRFVHAAHELGIPLPIDVFERTGFVEGFRHAMRLARTYAALVDLSDADVTIPRERFDFSDAGAA